METPAPVPDRRPDADDPGLDARLHRVLDGVAVDTTDPARARYRSSPAARPGRAVRAPAFAFVAGVLVTLGAGAALTGSVEPRVWLERAEGGMHRVEDTIVPAAAGSPTPSAVPTPDPAPSTGTVAAPPTPRATPRSEAIPGNRDARPSPVAATSPSPSSDGGGGRDGGHDGGMSPSPSPSSTPSPSPKPSSGPD